ncbi:VOC family protein [Occultella gossypii]|uniref:VOC family protein n=1 Tax=Occultella gossypii TaxID=2800820 RepID=A0ABS7SEI8_9MICO|nr:VOC family protein [Occultella gossypii]MBZ2198174.1 VOC family protein [Occultella gossypii]
MTTTAAITLGAFNMEAEDPTVLAAFWAELLGSTPNEARGNVYLEPGPGGFGMFIRPANGPRPDRQGAHLDLTVAWGSRTAEVARAIALGATHRWDVLDEVPWVQWSTLADPEGNLFCLAEHPPKD